MKYIIEVRDASGRVSIETQVSSYDSLVKRLKSIMMTYNYAIDVFSMEPFARMGGSSYHGWTTEDRKVHSATIKYGRAESGPLARDINESLELTQEYGAESRHTDAEMFGSWLIDNDLIFHELTSRQWQGPNFGTFRSKNESASKPTRKVMYLENFHMFDNTDENLFAEDTPYPFEVIAEEGLEAMALDISRYLLDLVYEAAIELDYDEWLGEEMVCGVDLTDRVLEDEITLIFPDNSEVNLVLDGPVDERKVLIIDRQQLTAELVWKTGLKIVDVAGMSVGNL
jgi:hypothetical protein